MAANVESMFYVRETPWHGLGVRVNEAPASKEALTASGLDWNVIQEPIYTETEELIKGYKANVRDSDRRVLGVVTDCYKVIQNTEAFAFTDSLLGEGVRYETAGSLQGGRKVWLLAHMPHEYIISGERISPYLLFSNTHDGSGAVKIALTPIRVVCNNTLNLALSAAKRSWPMLHIGDIRGKITEAGDTLFRAESYMDELGKEFETLRMKKLTDKKVMEYIEVLLPAEEGSTPQQARNMKKLQEDMRLRYFEAPDLQDVGRNAYRFINAVSDFATHAQPLRKTANYKENLFSIADLIRIEEDFWENHVVKGKVPAPDGSELADSVIAEYFKKSREKTIELTGFDEKLERRQELAKDIEDMETEKRQIEQELKLYLGEAEAAKNGRYRVSWKSVSSQRIDEKRLKEECPEVYEKYRKTTQYRRFLVKAA